MVTIYVFENFFDQPTETVSRISRATEAECVAVFDEQYGSNDYSWSHNGIADSNGAADV